MDGLREGSAVAWRRDRVIDSTADLERLVLEHLDRAYRLASVILGNTIEAEDAVSDAALQAWRSRSRLREPDRFEAWFTRIVVNVCRDRLRVRHRTPIVEVLPEAPADPAAPDDFREPVHLRDELERAFDRLPPDDRIVLTLRFWADLPVGAIGERLGIPSGTVKSRLHHALARLRAILEPEAGR
jgi:RNA polymerase sigma-70 factor (ECF subfamily)